jgi:hypothetical protein
MARVQKVSDNRKKGMVVKRSVLAIQRYFLCFSLLFGMPVYADINWMSATLDNDFFVNEDNGYTNGVYVSFYDIHENVTAVKQSDFWVAPLMWSMPKQGIDKVVNVYSAGQALTTSYDIAEVNPEEGSLPYSGLLSFTNTYITANADHADRVSTTLGVVGPLAMGEQTQKTIHKIIGAQKPMGWDTQLENEVVFEFSRGRSWRTWVSDSGKMDFLSGVDASVGTLRSGVSTGVMLRYGHNLDDSYPTVLLSASRSSNPLAVNRGWFVYTGVKYNYIFNQIFTDGNTFRDSQSVDYDHNQNMFTSGLSYSWGSGVLAFAINAPFTLNGDTNDRELDKLTRYGTLTFAWQI